MAHQNRRLHSVAPPYHGRLHKCWAWRQLAAQVMREEPTCRLQLARCTGVSECVDHIVPLQQHPELLLERSNCQGACNNCNYDKGSTPMALLREPKALSFFTSGE